MRNYAKRRNNLREGAGKAYVTIWDVCSPALRSKLQPLHTFDAMEVQRNPPVLMKAVSKAICGHEEHNNLHTPSCSPRICHLCYFTETKPNQ